MLYYLILYYIILYYIMLYYITICLAGPMVYIVLHFMGTSFGFVGALLTAMKC